MDVIIRPDAQAVAETAADIFERFIRTSSPESVLTLGLATGSTPLGLYQELIRRHREQGLSFAHTQAFLLDEYIGLPHDNEQSYYRFIRDNFTSHIDIADSDVHSPDGIRPDFYQAADDYDASIIEAGGIDIQLLGIGTNGHIGFNEPGSSLTSRTRVETLHPQTIADNARFFDSLDDVPVHVLTQGLGTITDARNVVLVALGEGKADAVAAMVEGPLSAFCPASILQWHPHATVIVDEAAGSKLHDHEYYRFAFENRP